MRYGVEIWGWEEREGMERLEERLMRCVLGVDGRTPGYMIREEIQREKLKGWTGRRAWGFEERLREGRGSELARRCLQEMRERCGKGKIGSKWEESRKEFFEKRGMGMEEVERIRENGEERFRNLEW